MLQQSIDTKSSITTQEKIKIDAHPKQAQGFPKKF